MSISKALNTLLASRPPGAEGGFVIFRWDTDFLQFSLEPLGLMFNWPIVPKTADRVPLVLEVLAKAGLSRVPAASNVRGATTEPTEPGQFYLANDGVYAQCGRDLDRLVMIMNSLMKDLLDVRVDDMTDVNIELYN